MKTKEMGGSHPGWNLEDRPPDAVLSKVGRTSETVGAFQIHSRKTRITRARAP